ncbi:MULTISPECIES: hypothetical protein [unclassified Bradyrhizobium]|uniref:hypothetical protein n=1 Tax=unclassified Bradyrhizobium TaxID=2631580 RepID=UPI0028EE4EB4|nr:MULTISPECIES: hypothetical protein [unclassified Bradyrhizobium]
MTAVNIGARLSPVNEMELQRSRAGASFVSEPDTPKQIVVRRVSTGLQWICRYREWIRHRSSSLQRFPVGAQLPSALVIRGISDDVVISMVAFAVVTTTETKPRRRTE